MQLYCTDLAICVGAYPGGALGPWPLGSLKGAPKKKGKRKKRERKNEKEERKEGDKKGKDM